MPRFAGSYRVLAESPLDVISFEECLVRYWRGNNAILLFYVNPPSVIIGRNQNYWREVAPNCMVPVFRRASGGGAVYHDLGNLNWSLIVPRGLHSKEEELCLIAKAISKLGVYTHIGSRGEIFVLMGDGETEAKISGTARYFGTHNVLHHGTLLVSSDLKNLHTCLGGIKVLDDNSIASVPATPINLIHLIPSLTVYDVMSRLSLEIAGMNPYDIGLAEVLNNHVSCVDTTLRNKGKSESDLAPFINPKDFELFKAQFGSMEWIKNRSPAFSILLSSNNRRIVLRIEEGRVSEILPFEPNNLRAAHLAAHLKMRFAGLQFDFNTVEMISRIADDQFMQ